MPKTRSIIRAVPAVAAFSAAALAAQAVYTVQRDLPSYEGFDASAELGPPDGPKIRITAFGDSTLTGPGLRRPDHIWIRQAIGRITDRYHVILDSRAVGGSRTDDVAAEVRQLSETDIAVVVVGSNDALHGVPTSVVRANLVAVVDHLLPRSGAIILAGVGDLGAIPRMPSPLHSVARLRGNQVDAVIEEVSAISPRIQRVPMWQLTASRFQREHQRIFAGDLFHPNEHGHRIWADAFYPSLIRALATLELQKHREAASGSSH